MKVEFLTPFRLEKIRGEVSRRWLWPRRQLWLNPAEFRARVDDRIISVPAGYVTDLGSVPRIPLAYLIAGNVADESALIHDWLYFNHEPRAYADEVFYWSLVAEGEPEWICRAMWAAVRGMGWTSYL